MKTITKLLLFIALCCALMGASCKKNNNLDDGLPPLTFEGKNTIGCKINGVPWVPKGISGPGGIQYPTSGGYYEDPFFFQNVHIWIKTYSSDASIELFVRNYNSNKYLTVGKYLLDKSTGDVRFGSGQIHSYGICKSNAVFMTDNMHTGYIEILKSDSVNKIISGRFEFDGYNAIHSKTYKITEGRFDYRNH